VSHCLLVLLFADLFYFFDWKFQGFRENLLFGRGNGMFLFGFGLGGEESRSYVREVGFVMDWLFIEGTGERTAFHKMKGLIYFILLFVKLWLIKGD
jgi:hypothetical protein